VSYFDERANKYDSQQWAIDQGFLKYIDSVIDGIYDLSLDVGCGTGIITRLIAEKSNLTVGIDRNRSMLGIAVENTHQDNIIYMNMDAHYMRFSNDMFDLITSRNCFRFLDDPLTVATNCYLALDDEGLFCIIEGVPPSDRTRSVYKQVFDIKGKRNIFMERDLVRLMKKAGFSGITTHTYILRSQNIWDWLRKDDSLTDSDRYSIMDIHINMTDKQKKDYGFKAVDGNIFCDFTNKIVIGRK